jgi:hypothetical protein
MMLSRNFLLWVGAAGSSGDDARSDWLAFDDGSGGELLFSWVWSFGSELFVVAFKEVCRVVVALLVVVMVGMRVGVAMGGLVVGRGGGEKLHPLPPPVLFLTHFVNLCIHHVISREA